MFTAFSCQQILAMSCEGGLTDGGVMDANSVSIKNDTRAPVDRFSRYRDLPLDREVIGTLTVYNGNNNISTALGPALTGKGTLPVERFLSDHNVNIDLRSVGGRPVLAYELKLGAKKPGALEENVFRDLIGLVGARFKGNVNFQPIESILEGNIFYGRVLDQKLVEFYTSKEIGFEKVKLSTEDQAKIPGQTIIKISLGQLLEASTINYQPLRAQSLIVQDLILKSKNGEPFNRQGHFFDGSDIMWGSNYPTGHYSTMLVEALKVVESAYSDSKNGLQYSKKAIEAPKEKR